MPYQQKVTRSSKFISSPRSICRRSLIRASISSHVMSFSSLWRRIFLISSYFSNHCSVEQNDIIWTSIDWSYYKLIYEFNSSFTSLHHLLLLYLSWYRSDVLSHFIHYNTLILRHRVFNSICYIGHIYIFIVMNLCYLWSIHPYNSSIDDSLLYVQQWLGL